MLFSLYDNKVFMHTKTVAILINVQCHTVYGIYGIHNVKTIISKRKLTTV